MNWYLVKLIFSIEVENRISSNPAEFDEQLRLIEDHSQEAALLKARKLGKSICTTFHNTSNQKVSWRFIDVREIIGLDKIHDGIEIYSNTVETSDREEYIRSILLRSMHLTSQQPICN